MSLITDRIGRHEVLLPINHNHYNFREKQIHLFEVGFLIPIIQNINITIFDKSVMTSFKTVFNTTIKKDGQKSLIRIGYLATLGHSVKYSANQSNNQPGVADKE